MRKSKYDQSSLPVQNSKDIDKDNNISKIENRVDFDTELVKEFMTALSSNSRMTLHFKMFHGENSHHIIEAMFKGLGRALGEAVSIDEKYRDEIPSTKGVL